MAASKKVTEEVARVLIEEVGKSKAETILSRIVAEGGIERNISVQETIIRIRQEVICFKE